ncbi:ATP-binding protein [Aromatoleum petrolei]|nr:ATP-binding protein [Aromatoleum petrolei]
MRTERFRLLQLRWLSVAAMGAIALIAFPLLAPAQPVAPLIGVTLILGAVNLALRAGVPRGFQRYGGAFNLLASDLIAWGAFLYFGGGVTNPAISLLLPLVAVGAAVLSAREAWALAVLAGVIYSLLWQFHHPVHLANADLAMHWHLAGMWLTFAVSAATVVWFVSRLTAALSHREHALAAARAARARDAYLVGLGQLAAGAAHRLGTPLGTLRILVDELARRPGLDGETGEDLALMREQIDHCKTILTGLTREAGQQRAEGGGAVVADDWVEAVVARWRQLRPHASAVVRRDDALAGAEIVADASLGEALHNLIDNAANANAGVGAKGVEISVGRAGDAVVIEVADRGAGIPELVRETARHGPLTERPEGMGVGLFLAYVAVEHHGGTLDFRPRPGGGTVARLAIPLRSARP